MSTLTQKQRTKLNSSSFGVPELRKFPLNDEEHTKKAIQMFHHCPIEYKKELANNIYKKSKLYNIEINKDSIIYDYLSESFKEEINFIFIDENWDNEFNLLLESIYNNSEQAREIVDTCINNWKQRKKNLQTAQEKNALLMDIKHENNLVSNFQKDANYSGIMQRVKQTNSRMEGLLIKLTNRTTSFATGSKSIRNSQNAKFIKNTVASVGAGIAVGVMAGKNKAKNMRANNNSQQNNSTFNKIKTTTTIGAKSVGKGALVGLGTAAVAAGVSNRLTFSKNKSASDEQRGIKQQADRYVSFIQGFSDEVINSKLKGE